MTNAVQDIWKHANARPTHVALREGQSSWTYAGLRRHIERAADELCQRGVSRGDKVLMVVPTTAEFVFIYYGILAIGATAVTVNTMSTAPEIEYFVTDAGCRLAIGFDDCSESLESAAASLGRETWIVGSGVLAVDGKWAERGLPPRDLVEVEVDEPAALLYTSGTTGKPKGAILTHGNLLNSSEANAAARGSTSKDRVGTSLPMFHVYGQVPVMGTIFHLGGSLSLLRGFDAIAMLEMVVEHRLTELAGVPTMWNEMLHAETSLTGSDLGELRMCLSGGAPLPVAVKLAFSARFDAQIIDGYGLTETSGAATAGSMTQELKEGSVGRAVPGTTVAILDSDGIPLPPGEVGEVGIDGLGVMRGYLNRPEANAAARKGSWFLSGDLGRMDDDGDLWIVGRLKELIIRGGYNVYPSEVEDVLYSHPAVLECAVLGIPDERLGEEVAAVLVLTGVNSIEPVEMRAWLEDRLSAYKIPRVFLFVDELPKGATGKILKRALDPAHVAAAGQRIRRQVQPGKSQVSTP